MDDFVKHLVWNKDVSDGEFSRINKHAYAQFWSLCPCMKPPVKRGSHKGNGTHKGIFAGTLTMSTKDELTQDDIVTAIRKLMKQKSCPIKRYVWYLEQTTAGTPHIHFMYETMSGGRIERKHFKRIWPIWDEDRACGAGFRGGYHKPVHSESDYLEYVQKDNSPVSENYWDIVDGTNENL